MFKPSKIVVGTIGYAAVTFPLAYFWHLSVFASTYADLGYFSREEPIVVYGFFAILLQGVLLAVIYPLLCHGMTFGRGVATFAIVMGIYHWSMHVLAAAAKQKIEPLSTWFALESLYLLIQFSLGGVVFASVYRNDVAATGAD